MLHVKRERDVDADIDEEAPVRKCPYMDHSGRVTISGNYTTSMDEEVITFKKEEMGVDTLDNPSTANTLQENGIINSDCSAFNDDGQSMKQTNEINNIDSCYLDDEDEDDDYDDDAAKAVNALKMNGFDVLDDLDPTEEDENCYERNSFGDSDDNSDWSSDDDVPQDEIEAMLEEGLPATRRMVRKPAVGGVNCDKIGRTDLPGLSRSNQQEDGTGSGEQTDNLEGLPGTSQKAKGDESEGGIYEERVKTVLEELGHNHFDVLPEGWVQVTHNSGMPIFLNRATRVCTMSKPYFLGPGSARKHEVPLSAIPCLQYLRALEAEEEAKNKREQEADNDQAANGLPVPSARIETAQENKKAQSLTTAQVKDYCLRRFNFKSVSVLRFKSWSDRRKHTKNRKQQRQLQRPTLPEGTKLIKFPVHNAEGNNGTHGNNRVNKEWIMNPNGKSYVCILHEYVQHALKKQPSYQFKELENAATPYSATVTITVADGSKMQYGVGYGTSKKQAKSNAAKATLEIMIPEMREKIQEDSRVGSRGTSKGQDSDLSFFDDIKIEDPRVAELCAKTTEPPPHDILVTCLQRNFGQGEMHINYEVNSLRHQKNQFTMTVGKHTATLVCKNKRDGKQRAAQAILQLLHPHINSWGSLLRLYGNRSIKNIKEKKQEEQEITLLQSRAAVNCPNFAILGKLSQEMKALKQRKAEVQPIGKFSPDDLPTGNGADLNNVDL